MNDKKAKLLKKYMGEVKVKRQTLGRQGLQVRDRQEIELNSSLSSESQSEQIKRGRRVQDSEQQIQQPKPKKKVQIEVEKKSKTVSKGIRKALGLKKGQEIDQFISALKIEGVDMKDIESYLKHNKEGLIFQSKKEKKQKKKRHKQEELQVKRQYQQKESSSYSDFQIPEQARTIYRDKEGRIKQFSEAKQKEMKVAQVMNRLGEWQKGMKNQDQKHEEQQQDNHLWDDPARRWESSTAKHPLRCPYQGYANRFNIKPGYRWDGVIRGNGFETTYLQEINIRKAEQSRQQRQYLKNL